MNLRMDRPHVVLFAICLWATSSALALAQVPHLIRYQGQAVDSQSVPLEGPYTLTFRLYDAETAGTKVWEEIQSNVPLQGGHFSVLLGQVTPLNGINWGVPCWLSVQVGADPELAPRQRITSVPLAIKAESADTAKTSVVTERLTVPVTTETIADDANKLVPSGAVMFFDMTTCPAGWTEMTDARGRYLVGLSPGGTLKATVGALLSNNENRPTGAHGHGVSDPGHTHTYPLSIPGRSSSPGWHFGVWAANDQNWYPQRDISRDMTGIAVQDYAGVPGTNAPYLQLLVCKKD